MSEEQRCDFHHGHRFYCSPLHPGQYLGLISLSNGHWGLFPHGQIALGISLTSHLYLMLRSIMHGAVSPLPHVFMIGEYFTLKMCCDKELYGLTLLL